MLGEVECDPLVLALWQGELQKIKDSFLQGQITKDKIDALYIISDNEEKNTLLNLAAIRGYNEIMVLLLEKVGTIFYRLSAW